MLVMCLTQWWAPTKVRVSGDGSMKGCLLPGADGGVRCNFGDRLVVMANHQVR